MDWEAMSESSRRLWAVQQIGLAQMARPYADEEQLTDFECFKRADLLISYVNGAASRSLSSAVQGPPELVDTRAPQLSEAI